MAASQAAETAIKSEDFFIPTVAFTVDCVSCCIAQQSLNDNEEKSCRSVAGNGSRGKASNGMEISLR